MRGQKVYVHMLVSELDIHPESVVAGGMPPYMYVCVCVYIYIYIYIYMLQHTFSITVEGMCVVAFMNL